MAHDNDDMEKDKRHGGEKETNGDAYKYLLTFLGGLAAGVALGMYLNSKQGKKIRKQVMRRMSDLELEIEDKVNSAMDEMQDLAKKAGITTESKSDEAEA